MSDLLLKFGYWLHSVTVTTSNFIHKSLCIFVVNIAVGCTHACLFCYVPSVSAIKQKAGLSKIGVIDPDSEWGNYLGLRTWNETAFLKSLLAAERQSQLSPDGNRVILYCSTTDAYQVISGTENDVEANALRAFIVRKSLKLIRDKSTMNVRILTRSPLVKQDFDLLKSFGNRAVLGMSIPSLNSKLVRVYEPNAPDVKQRLKTLQEAKAAGLHLFVAIAPTYPECDEADLRATLEAIKPFGLHTLYHEPINMRAENVERIEVSAREQGTTLKTDVYETKVSWWHYATDQLYMVQRLCEELGLAERLKLWPDTALGSRSMFFKMRDAEFNQNHPNLVLTGAQKKAKKAADETAYLSYKAWLQGWWNKISAWPGMPAQVGWSIPAIPTLTPYHPGCVSDAAPETLEDVA